MSVRNVHGTASEQAEYAREELADARVDDTRMLDAYDAYEHPSEAFYTPDPTASAQGDNEGRAGLNAQGSARSGLNAQGSARSGLYAQGSARSGLYAQGSTRSGLYTQGSNRSGSIMLDENDPAFLFTVLEDVMPRYEDASPGNELQQKRELAEQVWDAVRKWMWANPLPEQRQAAAYMRGAADATPLHLMCKLHHPPVDVIAAVVEAAPEIVAWTDSHGWLPLHHACANGANPEVMKVLIDAYPQGKLAQDNQQRTPLHFYATRNSDNPTAMTENALLLTDSGAAELTDKGGMLPMHYACAYGTDTVVLDVLAEAYPESLTARESKGRTPMHLAMVNAHRDSTPHVVEFLLRFEGSKSTANARDSDGYLPLHLLALALKGYQIQDPAKRSNISKSLQLYLNAEPTAVDFLNALQALPDWLQDTAVVSDHVRNVLNEKIVRRLPTAILMLDGYMLVIIIVCFGLATANHIDIRYGEPGVKNETQVELAFLFVGASYFLIRELIQIASLLSLGSFSPWLWDFTNWLDVSVIFLVFYYAVLMTNDEWGISDETFRSGATFTQGILYVDVIVYLKSTYVDFAVFVYGVYYVVQRLLAFLIAVGVILLAFAQMFFFIYKNTELCESGPQEGDEFYDPDLDCRFPHCTFENSLLKVYVMMLGEIGDETRYSVGPTSLVAQILYVLYAFVVVILLSNVLIAIVTDNYEVIQNDRAAIVFWSNRLDFVAEMDAIVYGAQRVLCCFRSKTTMAPGAPTAVKETPNGMPDLIAHESDGTAVGPSKDLFHDGWAQVMQLFHEALYEDMDLLESWVYNVFRIFSILFIIPIWVGLGLVSAGLLWPPQIRVALFVQREAGISRAEVERKKLERLMALQNEMKALKQEMMREMDNDRDEMMRLRAEVETVQNEFLADLQQVKELLTSLTGSE